MTGIYTIRQNLRIFQCRVCEAVLLAIFRKWGEIQKADMDIAVNLVLVKNMRQGYNGSRKKYAGAREIQVVRINLLVSWRGRENEKKIQGYR